MVFNDITYRINTESCCFSGGFRPDRQANKGPTHPWFATTWHGDQVGGQYNKNYFKEFTRKWSLIHRRQKCCCSWPATWLPWRHVQTSKNREARISLEAKPRTKLDVTWLANSYGLCSFEDTMEDSRSNLDRWVSFNYTMILHSPFFIKINMAFKRNTKRFLVPSRNRLTCRCKLLRRLSIHKNEH